MPRTEEAKQRIREEQRSRILEAARHVFARKGLTATMDDIADEAGVSHGLAYRYFANKDAIFSVLVLQVLQAPSTSLQGFLEMPGTAGQRLASLVSRLVESRSHPESYQLLDQVLRAPTPPADLYEAIQRRGQELQAVLRQLIIEGQQSGEVVAGDPDQLVRALFASLDGLIHWATLDPNHYHDHFPDVSIFLRMLGLQGQTLRKPESPVD